MASDALLTSTQVAEIIGTSARTVQRRAGTGELPYAHKMPSVKGAYLFDPAVVDMYARQQAKAAAS